MSSYELNNRIKAIIAQKASRPNTSVSQSLPELMRGVVVAQNGDGWDVATIDSAGNQGRIYERVFSHPSESVFRQYQEVWLHIPSGINESPVILVSGGATATCMQAATQWAAFFD